MKENYTCPKEKQHPIFTMLKKEKSKPVCAAYVYKANEEKVFATYPSNLLKMRSVFLEIGECSIKIPGEADVQYRIMLNLARQDDAFSNSDIHVGGCQSNPCWLC